MRENKIAMAIQIIGWGEIVSGALLGLILLCNKQPIYGIVLIVAGIITGSLLLGFAEIIYLLEENVNKQKEMANYLNTDVIKGKNEPTRMLQDIESSLPKM